MVVSIQPVYIYIYSYVSFTVFVVIYKSDPKTLSFISFSNPPAAKNCTSPFNLLLPALLFLSQIPIELETKQPNSNELGFVFSSSSIGEALLSVEIKK